MGDSSALMAKNGRTLYYDISKPLYLQLRDILIEMIDTGELAVGDKIPGERALAELFDLSRVTVRKCIGSMVEDGYFIRSQGKETVVAKRKIDHKLGVLMGIAEELAESDGVITIDDIEKCFERPSSTVAKYLQIDKEQRVFRYTRVVLRDNVPIIFNHSYVPYEIGKLLEPLDLATARIFKYLESYGFNLSYGDQEISAGICNKQESAYLDYDEGAPVLVIRRTTYTDSGFPIVYEKSVYRGDEYQYSIRLRRKI